MPLKREIGESNRAFQRRVINTYIDVPLLAPGGMEKIPYPLSKPIESNEEMEAVLDYWKTNGITEVVIDTEFECSFNYRGITQLCLVQVFDGTKYYLIDGVKLTQERITPKSPLNLLFNSPWLKKVIFAASGDISVLKRHGLVFNNGLDIQKLGEFLLTPTLSLVAYLKLFLDVNVMGGKTITYESTQDQSSSEEKEEEKEEPKEKEKSVVEVMKELKKAKKSKQKSDWIARPIDTDEAIYSLSDVEYLFSLKDALLERIRALDKTLPGIYDNAIKFATINNNNYYLGKVYQNQVEFVTTKIILKIKDKELLQIICNSFKEYSRVNYVLFENIVPDCRVFVEAAIGISDKINECAGEDLLPFFDGFLRKIGATLDEMSIGALSKILVTKYKSFLKREKRKAEKKAERESRMEKKAESEKEEEEEKGEKDKGGKEEGDKKEKTEIVTGNPSTAEGVKKSVARIVILRRKKTPNDQKSENEPQKVETVPQPQLQPQQDTTETPVASSKVKLRIIRPNRK